MLLKQPHAMASKPNIGMVFLSIPIAIAAIVVGLWGQTALITAIVNYQERLGIIESYRRGWQKMTSYFWALFLAGIMIIGGFLLFVVPGIIFMVFVVFTPFIVVGENLKGMDALLKSYEYTKGRPDVWLRLFVIVLLSIVVFCVLPFLFTLLHQPLARIIVQSVISLCLPPFFMTALFLIYADLKKAKGEFIFTPSRGKKTLFAIIPILGFLAFLLLPSNPLKLLLGKRGLQNSAREEINLSARDAVRKSALGLIKVNLVIYSAEHGRTYPSSLGQLYPQYLKEMPLDPKTNQPYQYEVQQGGLSYQLCAEMEKTKENYCETGQ